MAKNTKRKSQHSESSAFMPNLDDVNHLRAMFGSRLRELRRLQGLSLRTLAEKSGLSANTLSLSENGKISPSISTVQRIAIALHVPITVFFETTSIPEPVIYTRHEQRSKIDFPHGVLEECGNKGLHASVFTFEPHSTGDILQSSNGVNEFIFCLSGNVIYNIAQKEYLLSPGDSLLFSSMLPQTWTNPMDAICKVIVVIDMVNIN